MDAGSFYSEHSDNSSKDGGKHGQRYNFTDSEQFLRVITGVNEHVGYLGSLCKSAAVMSPVFIKTPIFVTRNPLFSTRHDENDSNPRPLGLRVHTEKPYRLQFTRDGQTTILTRDHWG